MPTRPRHTNGPPSFPLAGQFLDCAVSGNRQISIVTLFNPAANSLGSSRRDVHRYNCTDVPRQHGISDLRHGWRGAIKDGG